MVDHFERTLLASLFMVGSVFLVLVFLLSSCVTKQNQMEVDLRLACIKAGGNWSEVTHPDNPPAYGCKMK